MFERKNKMINKKEAKNISYIARRGTFINTAALDYSSDRSAMRYNSRHLYDNIISSGYRQRHIEESV